MANIFITGSADGLGQLTAKLLISEGHQVVLHARNEMRAAYAIEKTSGAEKVLIADLSSIEATKKLAAEVNALGSFDAIIHNAGVYNVPGHTLTSEGIPLLFAVNSLAPYILTALIKQPRRLIYLTSGMHMSGNPRLIGLSVNYADTKLHDVMLCMAVARKWRGVYSNAVNPGWVPTKMGGRNAPDSLEKGYQTQAWLAVSDDAAAKVTGKYFHHKKEQPFHREAVNPDLQFALLKRCEELSGIPFAAD